MPILQRAEIRIKIKWEQITLIKIEEGHEVKMINFKYFYKYLYSTYHIAVDWLNFLIK